MFKPMRLSASSMTENVLLVEDIPVDDSSPSGGVISIWTLNRPSKLNALNQESHATVKEQCAKAGGKIRLKSL